MHLHLCWPRAIHRTLRSCENSNATFEQVPFLINIYLPDAINISGVLLLLVYISALEINTLLPCSWTQSVIICGQSTAAVSLCLHAPCGIFSKVADAVFATIFDHVRAYVGDKCDTYSRCLAT